MSSKSTIVAHKGRGIYIYEDTLEECLYLEVQTEDLDLTLYLMPLEDWLALGLPLGPHILAASPEAQAARRPLPYPLGALVRYEGQCWRVEWRRTTERRLLPPYVELGLCPITAQCTPADILWAYEVDCEAWEDADA